jgi:hypothetical protein
MVRRDSPKHGAGRSNPPSDKVFICRKLLGWQHQLNFPDPTLLRVEIGLRFVLINANAFL